jgi:YidC/Oxa1 family membrane protein insertase
MDRNVTIRWILFLLLSFVVVQAFTLWMQKTQPRPDVRSVVRDGATTGTVEQTTGTTESLPAARTALPSPAAPTPGPAPRMLENTSIPLALHPGEITTVTTQKYSIELDSVGAVASSWRLLDPGSRSYVRSVETSRGIELVRRIPAPAGEAAASQTWPLEISLREANAYSYEDLNHVVWQKHAPSASDDKKDHLLQFESPAFRGIKVKKTYSVPDNEYASTLKITVTNETDSKVTIDDAGRGLTLRWGPGLLERPPFDKRDENVAYDRAAYRMDDSVQSAVPKPDKEPVEADGKIEWAGVESKFFAALIVPVQPDDAAQKEHFWFRTLIPSAHNVNPKEFVPPLTMELATEKFDLAPKSSRTFEFSVYAGPKKYATLKHYKGRLESLMFHDSWSFMRWIYLFLTDLLNWIFGFVKNYGIAIILLTVIVRLAVFPLTQHSIRIQAKTMSEQQKVKPYIDQINEKYKDNPQEKNRQVWKVYQEHGISPFGALRGCVPMMLQLPIFFGLYKVSNDTIDLQGATFLWIKDLSHPDHLFRIGAALPLVPEYFNLLPLLMGATQMLATWVASANMKQMDPTQKQMMYMMPLMLLFMLYTMPSGLMLYWIASNIWQIGQTIVTNRIMKREEAARGASGVVVLPPAPPPSAKRGKRR